MPSDRPTSFRRHRRAGRRAVLSTALALPAPLLLAACGDGAPETQEAPAAEPGAAAQTQEAPAAPAAEAVLAPTPECADDDDDPTPPKTEGPYYKRSSPQRASLLEPGLGGTRLVISGRVLSTTCQPVEQALLDFWQADDRGQYDNTGFRLRGHQFTDASGAYRLETIVPGLYPGRTRHIHLKVQAPNRPALTTQLYFPGEAGNARDGIYDPRLLLEMQSAPGPDGARLAAFDFVLTLA
jgi:protocatechuate 3,4-dioxygenase beta subunit